jgi:hypothetical protein
MRVFEPLMHRNYALFWSSDLVASVGQLVREVALYWLAYEITGSAIALGVLEFCEAAPCILLGAVSMRLTPSFKVDSNNSATSWSDGKANLAGGLTSFQG